MIIELKENMVLLAQPKFRNEHDYDSYKVLNREARGSWLCTLKIVEDPGKDLSIYNIDACNRIETPSLAVVPAKSLAYLCSNKHASRHQDEHYLFSCERSDIIAVLGYGSFEEAHLACIEALYD